MRDMANPSNIEFAAQNRRRNRMILRIRPAVQTAFLLLWAAPLTWISERLGQIGRSIPSCVFHCYYAGGGVCPAASLSCPVGIVAQFCAVGITPMLAIGIVLLCGSLAGSLACGWACPFGFFQDLLAKIPLPKFRIPAWMGYGRYAVLIVLVIALPYAMGLCGVAYDDQSATTICAWCPAGAVEAGLPGVVSAVARGDIHAAANGLVQADGRTLLGWKKVGIIAAFLVASMLTFRPWCTVLCPLGGVLSLFNRVSVLHLRFHHQACTQCNTCRSRCAYGVEVDLAVNSPRCLRCMECTTCGAIAPMLAGLDKDRTA